MRSNKEKGVFFFFFFFSFFFFIFYLFPLFNYCRILLEMKGRKEGRKGLNYNYYLETSSQRGPLRVASRKTASISDLILRRARVS